jgi:hypothetical protein
LTNSHVRSVDVWSFFPVNLNADKCVVEEFGDILVFEAFFLHDVAPMACGVAYADENGLVFCFSFVKSLLTPGIPINRVEGVLKEVWTLFVN